MSHNFVPVQWSGQKVRYDLIVIAAVVLYITAFMLAGLSTKAADPVILMMRALGTCAFALLHIILIIGPMARFSDRFKPLLYNRRHFGVLTALIGVAHAGLALMWYHGSGVLNPIASAIGGYGNYGVPMDFPFESLGLVALIILLVMAATSHDFWLSWLSPPVWKALHMGVYVAYAALVGHVALGTAQFDKGFGLLIVVAAGAGLISVLHVLSFMKGWGADIRRKKRKKAEGGGHWISAGKVVDIAMNKAVTVTPRKGQRIAIFRHAKGVSAVMGVCSHQNGPLGEGCVMEGLITCPWHGFQFDPETGKAPEPFTDKVQTHEVKIEDGIIWVKEAPDPWGTVRKAVPVALTEASA